MDWGGGAWAEDKPLTQWRTVLGKEGCVSVSACLGVCKCVEESGEWAVVHGIKGHKILLFSLFSHTQNKLVIFN